MNRCLRLMAICFVVVVLAVTTVGLSAPTDAPQPATPTAGLDIGSLVTRGDVLIDVILDHHIDPPKRQELWLGGIQEMLLRARMPSRPGAETRARRAIDPRLDARLNRVSELATRDQFVEFVKEIWSTESRSEDQPLEGELEEAFIDGILSSVPGGARLISAKEAPVQEQLRGNRYIGTGIALGYDEKDEYPRIAAVIPGGPIERAGGKTNDLIVKIDDRDAHRIKVLEMVDLLRGAEGTVVTLVVKSAEGAVRTLTVTRGPVVFATLGGHGKDSDYRIPAASKIRYVKILQINGSTVHDLRNLERQFKSEDAAAVILDFRHASSRTDPHHSVLLADALLDGGLIGRLRTKNHVQEFRADRDRLFRDWPVAILTDQRTQAGPEWIAAALQDNHAATLVGDATGGFAFALESIKIPGSNEYLELATGIYERPSGQAFHVPQASYRHTELIKRTRRVEQVDTVRGGVRPDIQLDVATLKIVDSRRRELQSGNAEPFPQQPGLLDPMIAVAVRALEAQLAGRASGGRTAQ